MTESHRPGWKRPALLAIDVQKDFCSGGLLAARETETLIAPLNRALTAATVAGIPVVLTRDWHPQDHGSFVSQGGPWPSHCIQGTDGAAFHPGLEIPSDAMILNKGEWHDDDGYSMFVGTPLQQWLTQLRVSTLAICGIATEYCVLESVRDALQRGFSVVLLEDLIRPIEVQPGDSDRAKAEMRRLGAVISNSPQWQEMLSPK